ncbi:MAG: hypothetical protein AB7I48_00375 [Planctomycetaceae bacterium]
MKVHDEVPPEVRSSRYPSTTGMFQKLRRELDESLATIDAYPF